MNDISLRKWWENTGVKIVNERTNNLIGLNLGYVPIQNLFTEEELSELDRDAFFILLEDMCDDGMSMQTVILKDGTKELRFFIN
jgi:hypothetical protein